MAQLADDCFSIEDRPLLLDEALATIAARISCVADAESVPLAEADHRILADAIHAPRDLPAFDNSAVDGYSVRFDDLSSSGETILPVVARVAAGGAPIADARKTAAIRIFTGAPIPAGCDTVFMQEDVRLDAGGRACLPAGLARGANLRLRGEDIGRGALALPAGKRLGPEDLALAAALGLAEIGVRRPLRVAVLSTGDEVAAEGATPGASGIHDANRPMILAALRRLGCSVSDLGIVRDRRAELGAAMRRAASGQDLVVTSGGVSVGDEDHVRPALDAAGSVTFWRLAIKPGRPVAMGHIAGTPFVGLPGNPVAAFVTFALLARPLLAKLAGETYRPPVPMPVRAAFSHRKKAGRREYLRASLAPEDGFLAARKHPREGAGMLTSLTESDGLVELVEAATEIRIGDIVGFLPYTALR